MRWGREEEEEKAQVHSEQLAVTENAIIKQFKYKTWESARRASGMDMFQGRDKYRGSQSEHSESLGKSCTAASSMQGKPLAGRMI